MQLPQQVSEQGSENDVTLTLIQDKTINQL